MEALIQLGDIALQDNDAATSDRYLVEALTLISTDRRLHFGLAPLLGVLVRRALTQRQIESARHLLIMETAIRDALGAPRTRLEEVTLANALGRSSLSLALPLPQQSVKPLAIDDVMRSAHVVLQVSAAPAPPTNHDG